MKNEIFDLKFDKKTGKIYSLKLCGDEKDAEFLKTGRGLAEPRKCDAMTCGYPGGYELSTAFPFNFVRASENERGASAKFVMKRSEDEAGVTATEKFYFDGDLLKCEIVYKNENDFPVYFKEGDIAFYMPFYDNYDNSEVATSTRCHEHINAAGENSYIMLERMGVSEYNLGAIFLSGNFPSYSQEEVRSNDRGYLIMNAGAFYLNAKKRYAVKFALFRYTDRKHFFKRLKSFDEYLHFEAVDGYTLTLGEKRKFTISASGKIKSASVKVNGKRIKTEINGNILSGEIAGLKCGDKKVEYRVNGRGGVAHFFVSAKYDELLKMRADFIVKKQQCLDKHSPLYGAYLIYDNDEKAQYYDRHWRDHNACRERFGMALLLLSLLKKQKNERYEKSINLFTDFLLRESADGETGEVFDGIGKDSRFVRLYNAPWVALYFTELFDYTGNKKYLATAYKILKRYYEGGGTKFYPNGIRYADFHYAFEKAQMFKERDEIYSLFNKQIENFVKNGTNYPPHEVNYEQTIVSPAVTLLLDKYAISGDNFYLREAEKHLVLLEKFDGIQPDYRLNKIPVRFWDDFWFGKEQAFGDTFPHYWSVLSGFCFYTYGKLSGQEQHADYGRQCIENCTCLFTPKGEGSCAYVYPLRINGRKGQFFDPFANDQDFALYFLTRIS